MSRNAEQYLISSIIRNGDMTTATKFGVNPSMFHTFGEQWEWMEKFFQKHRKAPSKTAFRNKWPDFRLKAADDTGHFAEEVKKGHSRHLILTTMKDVADLIADDRVEEAVQLGYQSMIQTAGAITNFNDDDIISSFEDIYTDAKARLTRVEETGFSGIPTGFLTLDERTGGAQPGDLMIVAARLGEGKSWTMQRMATTAVMSGKCVQYDALEQTRSQVAYRVHAFLSSSVGESIFRTTDLMQGRNFDPKLYKRFLRGLKKDIKGKLHVSDASRGKVGLMTVAAQIERNQPDIVFIDYLTLMDKKGGDWQDVAALSGGIKSMAAEYGIPIVAAAQLNRSMGLGKEPAGAEALAQSDAIGQDSDIVVTIKQTSSATMQMKLAKSRNSSAQFKWFTHFNPSDGVFEEVPFERYLDLKDIAKTADAAQA